MNYISPTELLIIHEYILLKSGGLPGIRSIELLESASFRPRTSFEGKDLYSTVFSKTAALVHSVVKNHPFADGNKRTAMVAGVAFLARHGYETNLTQDEFEKLVLDIANNKLSLAEITKLLEENTKQNVKIMK